MNYNIHLITGLSGGGAEHLVLDLSTRAQNDEKKVIVISVTSLKDIEHKFIKCGIKCHFLNIDSPAQLFQGIKKGKNILASLDQQPVVHCHMFHALFVAIITKMSGLSLKIVFTLHNNQVNSLLRRILLFLTKPLRCKDVIFSERGRKWYLKNSIVLPNGIDLSKFKKSKKVKEVKPPTFKFLFLGSLTDQKNPLCVPELIKKIKDQGLLNFKVFFIGTGPLGEALTEKIKLLEVGMHTELMGFRNDVPEILPDFHAQIMPSLWEGMPISLLESGAVGLPVISTPVGSIPDFLNEKTGYLSEIDTFDLAMVTVMKDYGTAMSKAQVFKLKVCSEFDIEKIYDRHQELYQSCL